VTLSHLDRKSSAARSFALLLILMAAGSVVGYISTERSTRNTSYEMEGHYIAQHARPDEVIFIADDARADYPALPMTVLYAHRNLAEWRGRDSANKLLMQNHTPDGVLFHFAPDGSPQVTRFSIQPIR
jgi:hypothetical protein